MMSTRTTVKNQPKPDDQAERFKQLARELECDEDEAHWDERLKKVAKATPVTDKLE